MPRRKRTTAMNVRELGPGARVFAYMRDSGGAGQERSVQEQRGAIERFTSEHGWVVVDWYVDEGVASGNYARRSEFSALIDACRADPPPVEGVIMYAFSRFGRDEYDSQFYRLELRRHGVQVMSVIDNVPSGPFAAVMEAIIDTQNRDFLDKMSRHVREGLRHNVEAGFAPGGTPPTGYRAVPVEIGKRRDGRPRVAARWVVDPEVGPTVTLAFRLAADGVPYKEIIAQSGVPLLHVGSLRSMLLNRSYLGILKFGAEEFPGALEPLVDQATWDQVQARFTTRAEQAMKARRKMATPFLLSGLAVCGECGQMLEVDTDRRHEYAGKGRAWRSYRCREHGRIGANKAEPEVIRVMIEQVLTVDNLRYLLTRMREMMQDPAIDEELAQLAPQIGEKRRVISTLLDAVEQGGGAATQERLTVRERELAQLEARRKTLEDRRQMAALPFGEAELGQVVENMRAQVTAEEAGVVRHVLRQWVERVTLWDDRCRVDFREEVHLAAVMQGYSWMPPRGLVMIPYIVQKFPLAFVTKM